MLNNGKVRSSNKIMKQMILGRKRTVYARVVHAEWASGGRAVDGHREFPKNHIDNEGLQKGNEGRKRGAVGWEKRKNGVKKKEEVHIPMNGESERQHDTG